MLPDLLLEPLVRAALIEDLGPMGDATCRAVIPPGLTYAAQLNARAAGVASGLRIAAMAFRLVDPALRIEPLRADGQPFAAGDPLLRISGSASSILMAERVALNFAGRMCGIASLTARFVAQTHGTKARITCTRKTTPGLRIFEKYAVAVGGGYNHRLDLSSVVMIKDNHLVAAGGIAQALHKVSTHWARDLFIELEVDNLEQLAEALLIGGVHAYLLDNMSPETIREAVQMVRSQPGGEQIFLEASGGMTYETLPDYLWTGVNGISIGGLTTRAQNVDIKLEFIA